MRANQIRAADGDPGAVGYVNAAHLDSILGTSAHHVGGDDAVGDDAGLAVDVLEKEVQGADALDEAGFEPPPVGARDDSGHAVDGNDAFVRLVVSVHGERDALVGERARDPVLHVAHFVGGEPAQRVEQRAAVLAGCAVGEEHLVVECRIEIVGVEVHGDDSSVQGVPAGRRPNRRTVFESGGAGVPRGAAVERIWSTSGSAPARCAEWNGALSGCDANPNVSPIHGCGHGPAGIGCAVARLPWRIPFGRTGCD